MIGAENRSPAVFLDRDGVIIEDGGFVSDVGGLKLLDGVPESLAELAAAGFRLVLISNQPVVARGLTTETEIETINRELVRRIVDGGGPTLDGSYFCPHHPNADLEQYRVVCQCRKPSPGMLIEAAQEHHIDTGRSFAVGDRITDIVAGAAVGCRTVLVQSGRHRESPIETAEPFEAVDPDFVCSDLRSAARWILTQHLERSS